MGQLDTTIIITTTRSDKMMNRSITNYLLLPVFAVLLASCDGDRYDLSTMIPDKYHAVLSFADTQIKNSTLYENISNSVSFKVLKGGSEPNSACSATIHIMTNDELAENYGKSYQVIPQSMYSISSNLIFPPEQTSADITVTFDSGQVDKLKEFCSDLPVDMKPCIAIKVIPYKGATAFEGNDIAISTFSVKEIELTAGTSAKKMSLNGLNDFSQLPMADINEANSISISMPKNVSNQWDILCKAEYRPDLIEAYNTEFGTDFEVLPDGVFSLNSTEINMGPGQDKAEFVMQFNRESLTGAGLYLIPIQLSTSMLNLDTELFYILAANPVSLTKDNFSSPCTASYDGNGLAALCDNTSSFWHSMYKDEPGNPEIGPYYFNETFGHYFQIRLDTPLWDSFRFSYWIRSDYDPFSSAPSEVRIYYSDTAQPSEETGTDNGWKELAVLTKDADNLPTGYGSVYSSGPIDLDSTGEIKHLRFCVISSSGGTAYPGREAGAHTAIAEFKIWGK